MSWANQQAWPDDAKDGYGPRRCTIGQIDDQDINAQIERVLAEGGRSGPIRYEYGTEEERLIEERRYRLARRARREGFLEMQAKRMKRLGKNDNGETAFAQASTSETGA